MSTYHTDRTPFLYAIGWTELNIWYLGIHYRKKCKPIDLWTTYFTSSRLVPQIREDFGEPDHIEIIATGSAEQIRELEYYALTECGIVTDTRWLNRSAGGKLFANHTRTENSKKLQSERLAAEAKRYPCLGEMLSITEISTRTGINRTTLWHRMKKIGMSADEAILFDGLRSAGEKKKAGWANDQQRKHETSQRNKQRFRNYEYKGQFYTTAELGRMCGASPAMMWDRLKKQGLSVEEAIELGKGKKGNSE
ncbi:hypothetical protein VH570_01300 [Sphingobium sp. HT1-2]|uniref:hypothetical protein n=1 Tax=Sphingobium sp. HT1-2 TaxID=3111640 RepID=UPI003C03BFD7